MDNRVKKYIFSTEYKTISEIIKLFEEVSGVPFSGRKVPTSMMYIFSEIASFYLSRAHPNFPQRFTPGAIRLLKKRRHANTEKARTKLGYQPTSIRQAMQEAYAFHYNRNAIHNPKAKPPKWQEADGVTTEAIDQNSDTIVEGVEL